MNVIDFISESSKYIYKDRPDAYEDLDEAIEELTLAVDTIRSSDVPQSVCLFSSYMLIRFVEDGVEELFLTKKLASLALFPEEEIFRAYGWIDDIQLDDPDDDGLD